MEIYRELAEERQKYIEKLELQIRYIRDQRGDDKCYKDWEALFKMLTEGYNVPERDETVELELCKQYIASCHHPDVKYVSPQRRIEELEEKIKNLKSRLEFRECVSLETVEKLRASIDESKVAAWDALASDTDAAVKVVESVWGPQFADGEQQWHDKYLVEAIGKALTFARNEHG